MAHADVLAPPWQTWMREEIDRRFDEVLGIDRRPLAPGAERVAPDVIARNQANPPEDDARD